MSRNLDRCLAYLDRLPPAISGSGGHRATMRAACECVRFGLSDGEMRQAMSWYNENRCSPAWTEKELEHKMDSAKKKATFGERTGGKATVRPVTAADLAAMSERHRARKRVLDTLGHAADTLPNLDAVFEAWKADPDNRERAAGFYRAATAHGMTFGEPAQTEAEFMADTFGSSVSQ